MRSRATGRSMAVGTAFVGGTNSLALAPLRVFLLDAEDFGDSPRVTGMGGVSGGQRCVFKRSRGVGSFVAENGKHMHLRIWFSAFSFDGTKWD